jgi:hypothetical protein
MWVIESQTGRLRRTRGKIVNLRPRIPSPPGPISSIIGDMEVPLNDMRGAQAVVNIAHQFFSTRNFLRVIVQHGVSYRRRRL